MRDLARLAPSPSRPEYWASIHRSLLGLAVSLIAISLAYQRYVFNDKSKEGT